MKNLKQLLLWLIMFSYSFIFAQQFKFEWARSFGGSKDEIPRIMKVDKKGDLYLFCEVYSSHFSIDNKFFFKWINPENYPSNAVLLKYSPSGELLWGRALKTNGGIEAYGIAIDQENNVVLSGFNVGDLLYLDTQKIYSDANFGDIAFLLKLDEEGTLLNFQTFEEIIRGTFYNQGGIAMDKSGYYYMPAQSRKSIIDKNKDTIFKSDLTKGRYLLLFKLDQDFNPVRIKKYYNVDGYFGDVKVDGEDNIIVYGRFRGRELTVDSFTVHNAETVYLQGDFGQDEIYILKINKEGKAIWLKAINGKEDDYSSKNDLTFDRANNIYLGGIYGSDTLTFDERNTLYKDKRGLNYYDIFYAKYDKDGNCIWARPIINGIDPIDDMSIQILPSGHLIVSGNFSNQDLYAGNTKLSSKGQSDCFVLLIGNSGEIFTGFSYGGAKNEYDKQLTSNGKDLYVLSNFSSDHLEFNNTIIYNDTTDGSSDAILIKFSLDSLISTNDDASKEVSIIIFPNPATSSIYLQLPENFEMGLCYYNIYSIKGDFISSGILQSKQTMLNVNDLPLGEYLINGGDMKSRKFRGKFVKVE